MGARLTLRQDLCTSFAAQAMETWTFLARGEHFKLLPGEETITDVNLLDLKQRHPNVIYAESYSRYREGRETAADWEWWISARDEWLGLRIQAKKLDPQSGRYEALAGHKDKALKQADMLIKSALDGQERLYPLYCFYNCWWEGVPDLQCNAGMTDPRVYGCALAAAPIVRELIAAGAVHFDDIAPHCIPWSCLFCGDDAPGGPTVLTEPARQALDEVLFTEDLTDYRGAIELEVPGYVETVWRMPEQMGPTVLDPRNVPDVTHLLLATSMVPRR